MIRSNTLSDLIQEISISFIVEWALKSFDCDGNVLKNFLREFSSDTCHQVRKMIDNNQLPTPLSFEQFAATIQRIQNLHGFK